MMNQPYEDGGIAGPRQKGLIDALQGVDQLAPDEATAMAHRNQPGNPLASIISGMGPQAGPTLQGQPVMPGANDFPGGAGSTPAEHRVLGTAAGNDMSWMDQPGAVQTAPSMDFGRLAGYDQGKFDANKQDAKYQMGRTLAGFDPRQGITPEVLAALNGLGYGTFSGSGQKLSLSGLTDKGRQNKLSGDYQNADVIQGFSGGNGKWQHSDPIAEAALNQSQPQQGGGVQPMGMGSINGMLHGDAQANIQQALGALQQPGMLQQLIAALQGGQ